MSDVEQRIKEHQDFWITMYGEEKWKEIRSEDKSKNPAKLLDFLDEKLAWYEENEFTEISIFSNVGDVEPKPFYLEKWLFQTLNPFKDVEEQIESYRETFDKKIKEGLPCCTISASFSKYRNLENIKTKNRLICIDIDRFTKSKRKKYNACADMQLVKELFMQHPATLYVGFSCSGDGVYAILRIFDSEKLDDYFLFFQEKFAKLGLNIDDSCKDYTRLRFFSVDREGYFNHAAKFYKMPEEKKEVKKNIFAKKLEQSNREKVEELCNVLEKSALDITTSYDDWMKIGGALYSEFGDSGIEYFHRISKFHPDYNMKEVERKYNQCKKLSSIKLSTLFYIATSYGARY